MSLNHVENIDPDLFKALLSLIRTGKVEKNGKLLDLSPVQTIQIAEGKVTFNPPLKVSGKFGPIRINTTVTEVSAKALDSILVDIDSSPINVEIKPNA